MKRILKKNLHTQNHVLILFATGKRPNWHFCPFSKNLIVNHVFFKISIFCLKKTQRVRFGTETLQCVIFWIKKITCQDLRQKKCYLNVESKSNSITYTLPNVLLHTTMNSYLLQNFRELDFSISCSNNRSGTHFHNEFNFWYHYGVALFSYINVITLKFVYQQEYGRRHSNRF